MVEDQKWIENVIKKYVHRLNEIIKVEKLVIFGSRARGDFMEDSDLDLIIISEDLKGMSYLERTRLLDDVWRKINVTGLRIEAFGYTEEEYKEAKKSSPFVQDLITDGFIELTLSRKASAHRPQEASSHPDPRGS